jgi:hypothetical protein
MSGCSDGAERVEQERSPGAKQGVPNIGPLSKNPPAGFLWARFRGAKPILLKIARKPLARYGAIGRARSLAACSASSPESPARFGNIRSEAT